MINNRRQKNGCGKGGKNPLCRNRTEKDNTQSMCDDFYFIIR